MTGSADGCGDAAVDVVGKARLLSLDEMEDELRALDADRYFSDDTIHVFDELTEILDWSPAEWDDSSV